MNKVEIMQGLNEVYESALEEYNKLEADKKEEYIKLLCKGLDTLKGKLNKLGGGDFIIKFGKFKGQKIKDVPAWYLLWCYEQDWFKEHNKDLYDYIKVKIKVLKSIAEQERSESIEPDLHEDYGDRDPN